MSGKLKILVTVIGLGFIVLIAMRVQLLIAHRNTESAGVQSSHFEETDANTIKMAVPAFQIQITLTEDAAKKLSNAGESIKGFIDFDGDGFKKANEDTGGGREVYLGGYDFARSGAGTIYVTNAVISEEAFKRLTNTDYYFTVNVFSARRIFTNNILDGGYAGGHISDARKAPIQIECSLLASP